LLLAVVAPSAGIQNRVGARALLVRLFMRFKCLKTIFADGGYSGRLINWALSLFGWNIRVKRCQQHIFKALPQALDCGEGFCLVESIEEAEQGLRGPCPLQPKPSRRLPASGARSGLWDDFGDRR